MDTTATNPVSEQDAHFLRQAIALSRRGMTTGQGGAFGCVIVKDGQVVGQSANQVTSTNDPTAHTDAAVAGFDDSFIYAELAKPYAHRSIPTQQALQQEAQPVFTEWASKEDRKKY